MSDTNQAAPPVETAPAPKKKGDLLPRVITSVVAVPPLLALIFWGPHWAWAALIGFAAAVGFLEFYGMVQKDEPLSVRVGSTVIGVAFSVLVYVFVGRAALVRVDASDGELLLAALALAMWAHFWFNLMRGRDIAKVAATVSGGLAGILYVGVTFTVLALFKRDFGDDGAGWVLMTLAMTWMSDTGAYFSGRALGKHRLAPIVSPKKSVEGAIGGLAAAIGAAFVVRALLLPEIGVVETVVLATVANVLGQTGDLCESLLKRSAGIKDSGRIVYGHGGILDRLDAVMFCAPWVYFFALYLGR